MLRQVFIIKSNSVIYERTYGNALTKSEVEDLSFRLVREGKRKMGHANGFYDYLNYRVGYDVEIDLDIIIVFVTDLMDDYFQYTQGAINNFKKQFMQICRNSLLSGRFEAENMEKLGVILDDMHKMVTTKIACVGFAGVGKTTIKKLIKLEELPLRHVPTITGDIATIRIGKLEFKLFDFAGQDEFKYLWKGFIKGSCAVLIVTDSTEENIEKSRFFLDLVENEAKNARTAIIGNKQDLPGAMDIEEIEQNMKLKTYPMVANRRVNRQKMLRIIADIMDINPDTSPLVAHLFKEAEVITDFEKGTEADIEITDEDQYAPEDIGQMSKPMVKQPLQEPSCDDSLVKPSMRAGAVGTGGTSGIGIAGSSSAMGRKSRFQISGKNRIDISLAYDLSRVVAKEIIRVTKECNSVEDDDLSLVMNALNCAFMTRSDPDQFPNFGAFLQKFDIHTFDTQQLQDLKRFYHICLERISEWKDASV